jgi:hypothetical protein
MSLTIQEKVLRTMPLRMLNPIGVRLHSVINPLLIALSVRLRLTRHFSLLHWKEDIEKEERIIKRRQETRRLYLFGS